jgi:hypothetical protein
MARVIGGLLLAAFLVGVASGLFLFGVVGVFVTVPVALVTSIVLGLPAYLLLHKFGWLQWWQLALVGVLLVCPFAGGVWPHAYLVSATLVTGAASGLVFWWAGVASNQSLKRTC